MNSPADSNRPGIAPAALAGVRVFDGLDPGALARIAGLCRARHVAAGATVVNAEDTDTAIYFILSGVLRVNFYGSSGKEVAFRDQFAGEMFGEISAIDGHRRSANVTALVDASLATLERGRFLSLVCEEPVMARNTLTHLASLIRSLSERVVEFSTLGVSNRIHSELLRLALATGADSGSVILAPAPKQLDVANRVSTHREAVSRELAILERHGVVKRERGRLVIVDLDELRKLVRNVSRPASD